MSNGLTEGGGEVEGGASGDLVLQGSFQGDAQLLVDYKGANSNWSDRDGNRC